MRWSNMHNFYLVAIVSALVSLPMLATDIYVSSLPTIQNFFHTTEYTIKLSLNAYLIGFAITTLLSGVLSDLVSKYWILLIGLGCFFLASSAIFCFHSLSALIIGRAFQGLGGGTGTVVARLVLKESLIPSKNITQLKALSIVGSSMTLSPLLGPSFGALLTHCFGWKSIFIALSIISLLLFLGVLLLSRAAGDAALSRGALIQKKLLHKYIHALKTPSFLFPTMAISLVCAGEFAFILNSSFFYQNILKLTPYMYGVLMSIVLCSFLLGSLILNKAIVKHTADLILKRTIQGCSAISLLPILAWPAGSVYCGILLIVSTIFTMAGVGIIVPLTQSIALNISKVDGAAIAGLFFFIEFLFIFLVGFCISLFSNTALSMIIGITLCWITLCLVQYRFRNERIFKNIK